MDFIKAGLEKVGEEKNIFPGKWGYGGKGKRMNVATFFLTTT